MTVVVNPATEEVIAEVSEATIFGDDPPPTSGGESTCRWAGSRSRARS